MSKNTNVYLNGAPITAWPELLATIDGIAASLPDNLTVSGDLYLNGAPVAAWPGGLTVSDDIDLSHAGFERTLRRQLDELATMNATATECEADGFVTAHPVLP